MKRSEQLDQATTYLEAIWAISPEEVHIGRTGTLITDKCPGAYRLCTCQEEDEMCEKFDECYNCLVQPVSKYGHDTLNMLANLAAEVEQSYEKGGTNCEQSF